MRGALVVVVFLLAGCSQSAPSPAPALPEATSPAWQVLGPGDGASGEPYASFDEEGGPDLEVSTATHPLDADTVLLTWTVRGDVVQAWTALTQDGGLTWRKTPMHDPALDVFPGPYLSW